MLLDEIEVYPAAQPNLAAHARYQSSQPAPTDPLYPDTGGRESTDGVLASGFWNGHGYGYQLTSHG